MYVIDGNGCDRAYLGPPRTFVVSGGSVIRGPGMELYWIRKNIPEPMTVTVVCPPLPPKHIKIPRPPNAYILYRKERHHLVKAANPGITNNEICELPLLFPHFSGHADNLKAQILGKAWNKEDPDVRALYQEQAFQVKQALLKKHPDYQYRPRRPSEKRRRRRSSPKEPLRAITDKEANDASDSASPGDSQCESKDSN